MVELFLLNSIKSALRRFNRSYDDGCGDLGGWILRKVTFWIKQVRNTLYVCGWLHRNRPETCLCQASINLFFEPFKPRLALF